MDGKHRSERRLIMAKQSLLLEKLPEELQPVVIEKIAYTERWDCDRINSLVSWFSLKGYYFSHKEITLLCTEINRQLSNAKPHIKRLDLSMHTVSHYLDRLDKLSGLCAEQAALNEEINAFEGLEKTEYNTAKLITLCLENANLNDEISILEKVILTAEARNNLIQGKG